MKYSCALTLARKFKLKTLAKTFKKFGKNLKFENKEGKIYTIYSPRSLKVLPEDKRFNANLDYDIDKLLNKLLHHLYAHI